MTPTNLTDEGLRDKAKEIVQFLPFAVEGVREDAFAEHIFTILQQVRDAAKKETVEKAALLAVEVGNYHDDVYGPSAGEYIATAIRQMDGGK